MKRSFESQIAPLDVSTATDEVLNKSNEIMTDESPRSTTTSEGSRENNYNNRGGRGGRGGYRGGYRSNQPKKPRQYKHAVEKLFDEYSNALDDSNNRKERIYKATRDVTIEAKQIIFNLHRYDPKQGNKEDILKEAKEKIDSIVNEHLSIVKKEIDEKFSEYFWKYARSYSFGLQELIEAISFYYYIKDGILVTCENIEKDTNFPVSRLDYLLGISDLSGELMRFATNHFTVESIPPSVKDFMSELFSNFQNLLVACKGLSPYEEKDLKNKIEIMETSLSKVEKLCYNITLQKNDKYVNYKL